MSIAQDMVSLYLEAERKVLASQSYTLNGRVMTRADLPEIRAGRQEWEAKLRTEQSGSQGGSSLYSVADFSQ